MKNKKRDEKQEQKPDPHKKKKIFIAILIIAITIALIFFGTKLYLFFNLFLGNDVLITLSSDKENIFLFHNQSETISIKTNIFTNPFCSVKCDFSFSDLSNNKTFEKASFVLKTINPINKDYTLFSPEKGTGQKLYRFDIQCLGIKTMLCHTTEDLKTRVLLITLDYNLSQEEETAKSISKEYLIFANEKSQNIQNALDFFNKQIESLNNTEFNYFKENITSAEENMQVIKTLTDEVSLNWNNEDYFTAFKNMNNINKTLSDSEKSFNNINSSLFEEEADYNSLIDNITNIQHNLQEFKKINVSESLLSEIDSTITLYNNFTFYYDNYPFSFKKSFANALNEKVTKINKLIQNDSESNLSFSTMSINQFNQSKIEFKSSELKNISYLNLKEPKPNCCLFNKCDNCCDNSCIDNITKYPIVFIHGHDFSASVSAEYNLNAFDSIQRNLEDIGYTNAGSLLLGSYNESLNGIWGKNSAPISIKVSYYFDVFRSNEGNSILQTKKDSLDTYAIRLNDIINLVKFKTNRNKVIIISHSMGGLVARRYMEVFGESSVDKFIMIATPNKGISGNTLNLCPVFGSTLECQDMDKSSLFINQLNNGKKLSIPIYNLIGIGCDTNKETGDGVVENSSAYFEGADNYYIKGVCSTINSEYFHTDIIKPYKYPETLEIIKKILRLN
jgi:hypothetical protein